MHKSWQRLDVHNRRYAHGQTNTVTSEHIPFLLFSFSVLHFLVVVSVRQIKLTHVGFRAHVKIASRIVSYRNTQTDMLIAILRSPTVVGLISCQFHVSTRTVVSLFRWTKSCHLVLLSSTILGRIIGAASTLRERDVCVDAFVLCAPTRVRPASFSASAAAAAVNDDDIMTTL